MGKQKGTPENTIRIGLSDEDTRFIERQRIALVDTRKEIFRCLTIVMQLDQDAEFMAEDEKQILLAMVDKWERMYRPQLLPKKMSLKERQAEVTEEVTRQIEKILGDYLPTCQVEVLKALQARLPVRGR